MHNVAQNTMALNPDTRRLIIGCGTGRCGTVSLTKFLNSQTGVSVLHEGAGTDKVHHSIPWYSGEERLWHWLDELERLAGDVRWYGDVGPISYRMFPGYCCVTPQPVLFVLNAATSGRQKLS